MWARALVLFLILASGSAAAEPAPMAFPRSRLEIATADGRRLGFAVEMATTAAQQSRGLMHRRSLAADAGMLFDFGSGRSVYMWMKDTFIPLDMLFIDASGAIVEIAERTVPHSLEVIGSGEPVRAVLELNGGTAHRLGIRPGDRVVHPLFGDDR